MSEENEVVSDDGKIATIMNKCFANITKYLNLNVNKISHRRKIANILDTIKKHKSVKRIKFHSKTRLNI